jgi:conjugative transfer pilus assembly protein TraH
MKHIKMIMVMSIGLCAGVNANPVFKNMQNFYSKFGAVSNSNGGSAYTDQSGGYMTGGSLFVRNPVRSQNLMSITPPGFRVGCGGIDIWSGGMSFISATQLKDMMNGIVSALPSYVLMLGIETYAPQIHTIMQQLNKMAADFNRLNINSCEAAAALATSVWPKSDLGSQAACRTLGAQGGLMTDYASSRHNCGQNPHGVLDAESAKDKESLVGEFNLAWKVLGKIKFDFNSNGKTSLNPFVNAGGLNGNDHNTLKEIMMTLSGTVIRKKHDKSYQQQTMIGKGSSEAFLTSLMKGGKIAYYKCDEHTKCLNPQEKELDLDANEALFEKIRKTLEAIVSKIQNDDGGQEATEAEMALVNATTLPVYKIINVTTAHQKGKSIINMGEYSEIIAFDVVYKYINDVFDAFQNNTQQLRSFQFTDEHIQPFMDGMNESRKTLAQHRESVFSKMNTMFGFVQKTQMIEKQLHHMMGGLSNEYGA